MCVSAAHPPHEWRLSKRESLCALQGSSNCASLSLPACCQGKAGCSGDRPWARQECRGSASPSAGQARSRDTDTRLDLRLEREEEVQGLARRGLGHDNLHEPGRQAIPRTHHLVPHADVRAERDDALAAPQRVQEAQVHQPARAQRVNVTVGDALGRLTRDIRTGWYARCAEQRLFHEVYVPSSQVCRVDWATAHSSVHLNEVRSDGRVLALDVEDAVREPKRLHAADGQLLQRHLLLSRQQGRAHRPSLVEVGLERRAVVGDGRVLPLALGHDDVDVHLPAVQVALHEEGRADHRLRVDAGARAVVLDQGAARDDERAQLPVQLLVRGDQFALGVHLLDPQGGGAGDRLQHSREAHLARGPREVGLAADEPVRRGWKARRREGRARAVLVSRGVHGLGRRPGQARRLGQSRSGGHGQLDDGGDAVHLPNRRVLTQPLDRLQRLVVDCFRALRHVNWDKLGNDALVNKPLAPRVRVLDHHRPHTKSVRSLVDKALALVAGCEEHNGRTSKDLSPQTLTVWPPRGQQPARHLCEALASWARLQLAEHAVYEAAERLLALLRRVTPWQATWGVEKLLHLKVTTRG
mmetsp:Transcript_33966/g.101325  ORF Transcript_33966/g.101325 Transcript_33966/m.101325 type:complete len:583 (+) Transcript_33966:223-1971(+)